MGRSRGNFHSNDEDPTQRFDFILVKISSLIEVYMLRPKKIKRKWPIMRLNVNLQVEKEEEYL